MTLDKTQKLLVHNVLFHYLEAVRPDSAGLRCHIEDVMQILQDDLTGGVEPESTVEVVDASDDDFDDEESDDDSHAPEADRYIDLEEFEGLTPFRVTDVDSGKKGEFRFSWDTGGLAFEFLDEFVSPVAWVKRLGREFEVATEGGDKWIFEVSKYPKDWTATLPLDKKVAQS